MSMSPAFNLLFVVLVVFNAGCANLVRAAEQGNEGELNDPHARLTEAEEQERVRARLAELTKAQAALNRERSFTVQVRDEAGQPVPGIEIFLSARRYLTVIRPSGKMMDAEPFRIKTDQRGLVKTPLVVAARFAMSVAINDSSPGYDTMKGFASVEFLSDGSLLGDREQLDEQLSGDPAAPPRLRRAPGIDWIFYVHKFIGPHPLVETKASIDQIPIDGTPRHWPLLHPILNYNRFSRGKDAACVPVADLRIRTWRDQSLPATIPDPEGGLRRDGTPSRFVNMDVPWWAELEAIHGGLRLLSEPCNVADPRTTASAPADGYADRVLLPRHALPANDPHGHYTKWLWWKRGGTHARFALVRLEYGFTIPDREMDVVGWMSARLFINPTPNDRLIERPVQRNPTWITDLKDEQALAWLAEPLGDPDPAIIRVAPRAIEMP